MRRSQLVVYEWNSWHGYLVDQLFERAWPLWARLGETSDEVLDRLPFGTQGFLFHIDLSQSHNLPHRRAELVCALQERGVAVYNSAITDITKRQVQRICHLAGIGVLRADRHGEPDERLVVKTNLNSGGKPEQRLSFWQREEIGLQLVPSPLQGTDDYAVMTRAQVPEAWWEAPHIVVERYIDNPAGRFHRAYVVGKRIAVSTAVSSALLRRMEGPLERFNEFFHLPDLGEHRGEGIHAHGLADLARFIECASLDYGAIDLVEDEAGKVYVVDLNVTPYWGDEMQPDLIDFLRGQTRRALAPMPPQ